MSTKPNKKDRRKLKALLAMHDKMYDYYQTLQPETLQHLEQDYTGETVMGLFQFQRNITDALKLIEHGTNQAE
jgi:hypothetical protein